MTDVVALAKRLFKRIQWQSTPQDVTQSDMCNYIAEGIIWLYTMTGRGETFDDMWFSYDENGCVVSFKNDLPADEKQYVLLSAQIDFVRKSQQSVDMLTSYSTDAMTVTHGDKPFANLQQMLTDLESQRNRVWHKMERYHLL